MNTVKLDRLLNQLNISPVAAKDKQLYQVISQLIITLRESANEVNTLIDNSNDIFNNIVNGKTNELTIPLHSTEMNSFDGYADDPYPSLTSGISSTIINNNNNNIINNLLLNTGIEKYELDSYADDPYPSLGTSLPVPIAVAGNPTITNDTTTAADMFPIWVTASSGALPLFVSSPNFIYRPSTSTLTTGSLFLSGGAIITNPSSIGTGFSAQAALDVKGVSAVQYALKVFSDNATDSFGVLINAGLDSGDYSLRIKNRADTLDYLAVRGDGNVGIGITNPASKFVVSNAGAAGIEFDPASGSIFAYNRSTLAYGPLSFTGSTFTFGISGIPAMFINATNNVAIDSTKKLYFDGVAATGDTYIIETSSNVLDHFVGGAKSLSLTATQGIFIGDVIIPATKKYFVDGGGDTYLIETSANVLDLFAGAAKSLSLTATAATFIGSITAPGPILSTGTGGIGYTTGAGGTVTQLTSRGTTVTLNKLCGNITMFSAAQAAQALISFNLTNSFIGLTDRLMVEHISLTNGGCWNFSTICGVGSATICIKNVSTGSITEATPLRFTVIKQVTA